MFVYLNVYLFLACQTHLDHFWELVVDNDVIQRDPKHSEG